MQKKCSSLTAEWNEHHYEHHYHFSQVLADGNHSLLHSKLKTLLQQTNIKKIINDIIERAIIMQLMQYGTTKLTLHHLLLLLLLLLPLSFSLSLFHPITALLLMATFLHPFFSTRITLSFLVAFKISGTCFIVYTGAKLAAKERRQQNATKSVHLKGCCCCKFRCKCQEDEFGHWQWLSVCRRGRDRCY